MSKISVALSPEVAAVLSIEMLNAYFTGSVVQGYVNVEGAPVAIEIPLPVTVAVIVVPDAIGLPLTSATVKAYCAPPAPMLAVPSAGPVVGLGIKPSGVGPDMIMRLSIPMPVDDFVESQRPVVS